MTLLSQPPPLSNTPTATTAPRGVRAHRGRPAALARPVPRSTWDPLTVDAEGTAPEDYDLPPVTAVVLPPLEDLSKVASILTQAVAEVLLGTRPVHQIQSWLFEDVWQVVRRRAALSQRSSSPEAPPPSTVRILRVHPCQVDERTCEVSVVLHDGRKVRAAALRLTIHRQRWRAAAIRIG